MYAVGKLAKGMENRGSSRTPNSQYPSYPYPPQGPQGEGYWGPPPPGPPPNRGSRDTCHQDNNQQRYYYPPAPNDPRDGSREYPYSQERYNGDAKPPQGYYGNGATPPPYGDYPPQIQGQYQGQGYDQGIQRGGNRGFDASSLMSVAGMAMNAVGGEGSSDGGKAGKTMGFVGELLKKK